MKNGLSDGTDRFSLMYFLFQTAKQRAVKKRFNGDAQTIAQLLNGGDGGAVIAPADDVVDGGLRHTAQCAQFVNGDVFGFAQLQYAQSNRFANGHRDHLLSLPY